MKEIKINKWDLIKLTRFCIEKENINKMKRQPTEWKKIFASYGDNKELVSKIYKQLNIKKYKQLNQKMGISLDSLVSQWIGICLPIQGHRFNPWSRKIPHAMEQLSPRTTTAEPVL